MSKTYSEQKRIRTCDCDCKGRWRISDVLALMQELAGTHAHFLGCGREVMLKQNIVWVLSRTELFMDRYPRVGETVRVETFPMNNKRWFFPRYYLFFDEKKECIGKAGALWLLMDFAERKMAPPEAALAYLPDNSDLTAPLPFPGHIPLVEGESRLFPYHPVYTDIDVNRHVNNTRYADMLCNALGMDLLQSQEIAHLLIHYQKEVRLQDELQLTLTWQEKAFRLTGTHGEEKHFDMGGEFRKRA